MRVWRRGLTHTRHGGGSPTRNQIVTRAAGPDGFRTDSRQTPAGIGHHSSSTTHVEVNPSDVHEYGCPVPGVPIMSGAVTEGKSVRASIRTPTGARTR
jgi:hypothetical protein